MKNASSALSSGRTESTISRELELFEPSPDALYSIEAASIMSNVTRRKIVVFCKHNLLSPAPGPTEYGYYFSGTAIRLLRRIEGLRRICGDDLAGIRIILELSAVLERLRSEIASLKRGNEKEYEKKQVDQNP